MHVWGCKQEYTPVLAHADAAAPSNCPTGIFVFAAKSLVPIVPWLASASMLCQAVLAACGSVRVACPTDGCLGFLSTKTAAAEGDWGPCIILKAGILLPQMQMIKRPGHVLCTCRGLCSRTFHHHHPGISATRPQMLLALVPHLRASPASPPSNSLLRVQQHRPRLVFKGRVLRPVHPLLIAGRSPEVWAGSRLLLHCWALIRRHCVPPFASSCLLGCMGATAAETTGPLVCSALSSRRQQCPSHPTLLRTCASHAWSSDVCGVITAHACQMQAVSGVRGALFPSQQHLAAHKARISCHICCCFGTPQHEAHTTHTCAVLDCCGHSRVARGLLARGSLCSHMHHTSYTPCRALQACVRRKDSTCSTSWLTCQLTVQGAPDGPTEKGISEQATKPEAGGSGSAGQPPVRVCSSSSSLSGASAADGLCTQPQLPA